MALPTRAAPALLGLERLENLCPCDLSPDGPHLHFSHSSRPRRPRPGPPVLPFLP